MAKKGDSLTRCHLNFYLSGAKVMWQEAFVGAEVFEEMVS